MADRNPTILPPPPNPEANRRVCPKCKGDEFGGQRIYGVIRFTCRKPECRNVWEGGLPREAYDPSEPRPPELLAIDYGLNPRTGEIEEIRQRPNPTPEYRKGILIDKDNE